MNVLVTSVGRRGQLVKHLQMRLAEFDPRPLLLTADASSLAPGRYLSDASYPLPLTDNDSYLTLLLDLCVREEISLVIPTIDTELELLAANTHVFSAQGVTVGISSLQTVRITLDKSVTHTWLVKAGFPVPKLWSQGTSIAQVDIPKSGVLFKPHEGSRSIGIEIHEDLSKDLHVPEGYLAQERIVGEEFTVSCYVNRQHRCVATVPRLRIEVRDGEVSKGVSVRDARIEGLARRISEALPNAWGPLNIQIIREEETQKLFVIEINPRFGGGDPLAWVAGCDMPNYLLREVYGGELPILDSWLDGVAMLRFDQAIYLDGHGDLIYVG